MADHLYERSLYKHCVSRPHDHSRPSMKAALLHARRAFKVAHALGLSDAVDASERAHGRARIGHARAGGWQNEAAGA